MGGTPETLYARDGDVCLAYQVVGIEDQIAVDDPR